MMLKLTAKNRDEKFRLPVWVNPTHIALVAYDVLCTFDDEGEVKSREMRGGCTILLVNGESVVVQETPEQVLAMLSE